MTTHIRLAILIFGMLSASASADIMVSREVKFDGIQGMGASTKTTQTWFSGNRQREQDIADKKATSFLAKLASNDKVRITRLDKKVMWIVDDPKKRYQEVSLTTTPTESKSESDPTDGSDPEKPGKPTSRVSKAEFKVVAGGQKKTINGYPCQDYTLTALIEIEDLESHEKSGLKMITTLWTTPETGPIAKLQQEETAYAKAWAQAIGGAAHSSDMQVMGSAMMAGLMGTGEKELSKALAGMPAEMKKVKGYPILTRVEWSGTDAGVSVATTTEIKSISSEPLPASLFEVPAGYKKTS